MLRAGRRPQSWSRTTWREHRLLWSFRKAANQTRKAKTTSFILMKKPLILFIKFYRMSTKKLLFNKKVTVNMQTLGISKDWHFFLRRLGWEREWLHSIVVNTFIFQPETQIPFEVASLPNENNAELPTVVTPFDKGAVKYHNAPKDESNTF